MNVFCTTQRPEGLTREEIREALSKALSGREIRKALILPPDFTRFHSGAGLQTQIAWELLTGKGAQVDILPALGTHAPVTRTQWETMFGNIPYETMIIHRWRDDVVQIGTVPVDYVLSITEGLWDKAVTVEVNRRVMDPSYDLILSLGQVVPHEVIGMSGHAKNLFVGVGGSQMINASHMIGAVYGMERMMGRDHTPVRQLFDYSLEHFLTHRPILFGLTVATAPGGCIHTHGLFLGEGRECLSAAVELAQNKNIDYVPHGLQKCVVYLDSAEYESTWLGNKAVYRTRMAMADGGELIVLAPGVKRFGEDAECDRLIRKYGYKGRLHTLEMFRKNEDLQQNMSAAAHLIHGSSDGRFSITYAVKNLSREEIESVGYGSADYDELAEKYGNGKLSCGLHQIDGEEVFYIPNPAVGLWINSENFGKSK